MKATFVYPNSRRELLAGIARGEQPDSQLHGALYLGEHGIDVDFHDPCSPGEALAQPLARIAWSLREVTVPYELGRTDVVFTPLAGLLPLAARGRRLPVVVINFGLNLIWRRASSARRGLLRRSLRSAARIICLGEAQRDELVAAASLDPERVLSMVIPVDDRFFSPSAQPDDGRTRPHASARTSRGTTRRSPRRCARSTSTRSLVAHPRNLDGVDLPPNAIPAQRRLATSGSATCMPRPHASSCRSDGTTTCTARREAA